MSLRSLDLLSSSGFRQDLVLFEPGEPVERLSRIACACVRQSIASRDDSQRRDFHPSGRVLMAPARASICGTAPDAHGGDVNATLASAGEGDALIARDDVVDVGSAIASLRECAASRALRSS